MWAQKLMSHSRSGPLRNALGDTAGEIWKASLALSKKTYAAEESSLRLVHTQPSRPAFHAASDHFTVSAYHAESVSVSWERSSLKCLRPTPRKDASFSGLVVSIPAAILSEYCLGKTVPPAAGR